MKKNQTRKIDYPWLCQEAKEKGKSPRQMQKFFKTTFQAAWASVGKYPWNVVLKINYRTQYFRNKKFKSSKTNKCGGKEFTAAWFDEAINL